MKTKVSFKLRTIYLKGRKPNSIISLATICIGLLVQIRKINKLGINWNIDF